MLDHDSIPLPPPFLDHGHIYDILVSIAYELNPLKMNMKSDFKLTPYQYFIVKEKWYSKCSKFGLYLNKKNGNGKNFFVYMKFVCRLKKYKIVSKK